MKKRMRSTWLTRKETRIFCIDFSGLGADLQDLNAELVASEAVIGRQAENSMLVTVDLHQTDFSRPLVDFFNHSSNRPKNPFRKMAILGVSGFQKFWYQYVKHVTWPKNAIFLNDYETAKDWLVGEDF